MERQVTEFDYRVFSESEIRQSAEKLIETLLQEGGEARIQAVVDEYPEMPSEPGICALTAPDGIMVKVVDREVTPDELREMIRVDISRRILRPFFTQGLVEKKSFEQLTAESFPLFLKLKKQYRLELLSGSSP